LAQLTRHLEETEAEVAAAAPSVPLATGDLLRPLGEDARAVREDLVVLGEVPPASLLEEIPLSADYGSIQAIFAALVTQSMLLVGEDDPLQRAYRANDVADRLAAAVHLASARNDSRTATEMNRLLGEVVKRGVEANLTRAQRDSPEDSQLAELGKFSARAAHATAALERTLADHPNPDSPTLRRELDTARHNYGKDLEKALKEIDKVLKKLTHEKKGKGPKPGPKANEIKGTIVELNPATGMLTLLLKDRKTNEPATFKVADGARIRAGPRTLTFADLVPGQSIKATLRDGQTLTEIKIEKKDD
jgi:hypothetical protein